jgi:hypothetical protein
MAVFVAGWLPIFYGSEVSPNLYVAAASVGAAGSVIAFAAERRRIDLVFLGVFTGAAVFLRPVDGLLLAVGVSVAVIVLIRSRPRTALQALAGIAGGLLIGVLPWLAEAFARFGGPIERLQTASTIVGRGLTWNVADHLRLLDGPLLGPDSAVAISTAVTGIVLLYAALAGFGVADRRWSPGPQLALALGMLIALPYLVYLDALAPRFLLPFLALTAVAVGAGVLHLHRLGKGIGIGAVLALVVVALWSLSIADQIETEHNTQRGLIRQVAAEVSNIADDDECEFISQYAHPQIMVASGCGGARVDLGDLPCQLRAIQERRPGLDILVALVSTPPEDALSYLTPVAAQVALDKVTLYKVAASTLVSCKNT